MRATLPQVFLGLDDEAFFPGQDVTGALVVVVTHPVKAVQLRLQWRGVEFVSWTEAVGQRKVEKERLLFDQTQQLWPAPSSSGQNGNALAASTSSSPEPDLDDLGVEVDLTAEPAKTSHYRSKPLKTYGGDRAQTLLPGTYTYHLRWKLPSGLPLVFEDSTSNTWLGSEGALAGKILSKGKSYIRYYATAHLVTQRYIQTRIEVIQDAPGSSRVSSSGASSSNSGATATVGAPPPVTTSQLITKEVNKTISAKAFFKVVEDIPLAALSAQPPIQSSQSKTFLFASESPLRLSITVANGGIAFAGKSFNATIAVDNKSSRTVDAVRVGIDCFTTFRLAAPRVAPVQAGLAGSQVQQLHPEGLSPAPLPGQPDYVDNVMRRDNVLNTTLTELSHVPGNTAKASTINVSIPAYWPGSIVTSVLIERRYEIWAECVITMGTNLITRCPLRLLEWSDHFTRTLPDITPVPRESDYDSEDSISSSESARSLPSTPAPGSNPTTSPVPVRSTTVNLASSYSSMPPSSSNGAASSSSNTSTLPPVQTPTKTPPKDDFSMDEPSPEKPTIVAPLSSSPGVDPGL